MAVTKLASSTPHIKRAEEPEHTTPLRERYFSILLGLQIVTLFVISPVVGNLGTQYNWIIDVFLILMACVSVFAFRNPLERKVTIFIFAICITGLAFSPFIADYKLSAILFTLSGVIFCGIVSWTVGEKLFAEGPVTLHRIQGAIVIYLNIAITFAGIDNLLVYLLPNAYSNICLVPKSYGISYHNIMEVNLWEVYCMLTPRPRLRSEKKYKSLRRASLK